MRCRACNCLLTDFESTRRSSVTNDFIDMCNRCVAPVLAVAETVDNWTNYDPERDDLTSTILSGDETPQPGDLGAGPDPDEQEDGGMF